jgi:hypothetical protein
MIATSGQPHRAAIFTSVHDRNKLKVEVSFVFSQGKEQIQVFKV